jgi:tetratricopeptide (TPR) repeat protein
MTVDRLIGLLIDLDLDPDPRNVAEALWLAPFLPGQPAQPLAPSKRPPTTPEDGAGSPILSGPDDLGLPGNTPPGLNPTDVDVGLPSGAAARTGSTQGGGSRAALPMRAPTMPALPHGRAISRALRPLRRRVSHRTRQVLDEQATVERISRSHAWLPVLRAEQARWLDVEIIVDSELSMIVWEPMIAEFQQLLAGLGAFRTIRHWSMASSGHGMRLRHGPASSGAGTRSPHELADPTQSRLILVVSDCVGRPWHTGEIHRELARWGRSNLVAILQPLPEYMWARTGLRPRYGQWQASGPVATNLTTRFRPNRRRQPPRLGEIAIPVLDFTPDSLAPWARLLAGQETRIDGVATLADPAGDRGRGLLAGVPATAAAADLAAFRAIASPDAFRLATCMSAFPVSLATMRLVQSTITARPRPSQLAEVLLGGLLQPVPERAAGQFEFVGTARAELGQLLRRSEAHRVRHEVSRYLARHLGISVKEFAASVTVPQEFGLGESQEPDRTFAAVPAPVLARLGGRYAELAEFLLRDPAQSEPTRPQPDWRARESQHRRPNVPELIAQGKALLESALEQLGDTADNPGRTSLPDLLDESRSAGLDEAIRLYRQALALTTGWLRSQDLSVALLDLSRALGARYRLTSGELADLGEAITLADQAGDGGPPDPRWRALRLGHLGSLYQLRFAVTGIPGDLGAAIQCWSKSLGWSAPGGPAPTNIVVDLAAARRRRYHLSGQRNDLDAAIRLFVEHPQVLEPGPRQLAALLEYSDDLRLRYLSTGQNDDLVQSVAMIRRAFEVSPGEPEPGRDSWLETAAQSGTGEWELRRRLAVLLSLRAEQTGAVDDLWQALVAHRDVLAVAAPDDRASSLLSIGQAEAALFNATGNDDDLRRAITSHLAAADAAASQTSVGREDYLRPLAALLDLLSIRNRQDSDLRTAVQTHRALLSEVPSNHPHYGGDVYGLARILDVRHDVSGEPGDLIEAIDRYRQALESLAASDELRAYCLTSLSDALLQRAGYAGRSGTSYLTAAWQYLTEAITFDQQPEYADRLWKLGDLLIAMNRAEDAADAYRRSATERLSRIDPNSLSALLLRRDLGIELLAAGHVDEARAELTRTTNELAERLGPDNVETAKSRDGLRRAGPEPVGG